MLTPTSRSGLLPFGPPGLTQREVILFAIVLAAGIAFRLFALSRSAVEHFDEGVYASNIYFGSPDYAYPQQRFYAPSMLPALIEAGTIAGLPPNLAALLPNLIAGCATIVALWWIGRSWFGPEVGLSAATLGALSDFHVMLSATALTDVLLGLWLVLAIDAIARSLVVTDFRWAIGGGIYTGLAWWTKYNGWLPLAIEAAALPLLWLLLRPPRRQLHAWLGCFAVTAIVACLVWSPYYFSLQSTGGYAPIAANHAKYVVGFAGWFESAARQISNQYVIEQLLSPIGVGLALAVPGFLRRGQVWGQVWRGGACIVAGALAVFWSSFVVVGVGTAIGIARMFVACRKQSPGDSSWNRRAIGLALLGVWWLGLLVVTPLYSPYLRLTLPWMLAAWLGAALNCAEVLGDWAWPDFAQRSRRWQFGVFVGALAGLFLVPWMFFPHKNGFGQLVDRGGVLRAATQVRADRMNDQPRAIYVYAEPAMFFQLRSAGEEVVAPVQNVPTAAAVLEGRTVPTFLIAGPHASQDAHFCEQLVAADSHWRVVKEYAYQPSPLVWLDLHDPRKSAPKDVTSKHAFRLYAFQP